MAFMEKTEILYKESLERKPEEKWVVLISAETKQMLKQWENLDSICVIASSLLSLNNSNISLKITRYKLKRIQRDITFVVIQSLQEIPGFEEFKMMIVL